MPSRKIIGNHSINEFLKVRPRSLSEALFRSDYKKFKDLESIHNEVAKYTKNIRYMGPNKLDKEALGHQGCVLLATEKPELAWQDLQARQHSLVVLLDGINDPQNLGAILRSAWLMGADAVFAPQSRASKLGPAVHKVASGAIEYVPLEFVSQIVDVSKQLKEAGFWLYGLAEGGGESLFQSKLHEKSAIIVGSEDSGMKKATEKACDQVLKIPQISSGSSYNASVSAALAMGEFRRRYPFS